ncbi:MAG: phosphoribosylanthranilate isomerase [Phycisphaerae bacterium]|nr:phosphoribosylanthranilate isomerase [Phycisphaerae bacterium]
MSRVRIKICGVTHEEHIRAAAESGAHLVGLVVWPGSPRAVTVDRARELAETARKAGLETVALTVDGNEPLIAALTFVDRIQCHGNEVCDDLRRIPQPTIKGFPFTTDALRAWGACPHAEWLLVDSARGGSGIAFDHAVLAPLLATCSKPVLLAGGLNAETVASAIATVRPFGVDVSSGVERTRGVKDPELIRLFCRAITSSFEA